MAEIKVKPLFAEAEKAIAAYQEEVKKLDEQEQELKTELTVLQDEMTANLLDQENASVSELVYLKIQAKEINQKTDIINVLIEELKDERIELKIKYVPLIRSALGQTGAYEYDATKIAEKYRYLMLTEIASIGQQMQEQYRKISPHIAEVYEDKEVLERFPRLRDHFTYENYQPRFSWFDKSVVSKNEVFSACRGGLPQGLKKPEQDVN
ncbi:hypothetical protein [Priestia koreensis]|uniref:hypothetical protein n=1 Tax=Priestia koreensis TaxID=284581 RepID=UPI00345A68FF